jgi:hypothetical protein
MTGDEYLGVVADESARHSRPYIRGMPFFRLSLVWQFNLQSAVANPHSHRRLPVMTLLGRS